MLGPKMKFSLQKLLSCFLISLLAACGGSTTESVTATAIKIFSDGAGVARIVADSGTNLEMVMIAPSIVAEVANANTNGFDSSGSVDVTQYPIISQSNGYNLRQGTSDGSNIIVAEKIGSGKSSIVYLWNNTQDAIATGSRTYTSAPVGNYTYSGLYFAGARGASFSEIGDLSLSANFTSNTFTINASGTSTSLTGAGFIDPSNGRISSAGLTFNSPSSSYTASTIGNLSGVGSTDVVGVFYTNDANPDYAGAFAGSR